MQIVDLEPGDERLRSDVLPVLKELRPHLTADRFQRIYAEGHPEGLRFTVTYDGDRCVAVAGWRIRTATVAGRTLYVDDLVTTEDRRSEGFGGVLLRHLLQRAADAGCSFLELDSAVRRRDAHRFYEREGLRISAYHFERGLDGPERP